MVNDDSSNGEDEPSAEFPVDSAPDASIARSEWEVPGGSTVAIVEAVAAATDRDPLDVALLEEAVDADALEALLTSPEGRSSRTVRVGFSYDGCEVVVERNGRIDVYVDRAERR